MASIDRLFGCKNYEIQTLLAHIGAKSVSYQEIGNPVTFLNDVVVSAKQPRLTQQLDRSTLGKN
ncbi:MAG: hypothetical protein F6J97_15760 [Leptolyngbya sp. SIO4C1]|nr:hypothetical protein [Leptolyngbya sp. SIO4C1]